MFHYFTLFSYLSSNTSYFKRHLIVSLTLRAISNDHFRKNYNLLPSNFLVLGKLNRHQIFNMNPFNVRKYNIDHFIWPLNKNILHGVRCILTAWLWFLTEYVRNMKYSVRFGKTKSTKVYFIRS